MENLTKNKRKQIVIQHGKCAKCGSTENLTVDHIISKAFLATLGLRHIANIDGNIQVLCFDCNSVKGSLILPDSPKTSGLLEYYVESWHRMHNIKKAKPEPFKQNSGGPVFLLKKVRVKSLTPETFYFETVNSQKTSLQEFTV